VSAAPTVGVVSPGAMGSAVGDALVRGGARVVATLSGRSERTARLAARTELELLPDLGSLLDIADVVLSIVPPESAASVARDVAAAAAAKSARPVFVELNAISPATALRVEADLDSSGVEVVDGSISGPPPWRPGTTRLYLSGPRAAEIAALPFDGVDALVVGAHVGAASAVKMSTASVYKGTSALLAHALLAAEANGVLEHVLDDLRIGSPELVAKVERRLASAASKSPRYVAEMHEIAATQAAAGLTPSLFEAIAEVFSALSESELARSAPEDLPGGITLDEVLNGLQAARRTNVGA
jgi:3-hydroxyisobutyrate dehydrogenase-like beta-hydroxyacid dehydrogenase